MTIRLRTGAATSLALGALLAGFSVLLGAGSAQAAPQALPVQVSFTDLMPGDVRTTSWPVQVGAQARVVTAVVHQEAAGGVLWTARLCPAGGTAACLDVLTIDHGTRIAAGEYVMSVGATVTGALQPGQTRTLEAHYTLVQDDDAARDDDGLLADTSGSGSSTRGHGRSLASTGSAVLPLALSGLAATTVGVVLVVLARRRRDGEPETAGTESG